ncbi:MAG: hypothetical protein ICV60_17935 [Pyrinomonadaceae bacterium]|nr:hypothetical protein [Pyrinomonadaceae bacterium]
MKRVAVVVNKWWEADPVLNALLHAKVRPASVPWPASLNHPRARPSQPPLPPENMSPVPRAVFLLTQCSVAVWCISDLLEHLEDKTKFQSSSQRKAEQMPKIFAAAPEMVIAVGTAGFPSEESLNGCVTVGSQIFMHNFHPNGQNPDSDWSDAKFDQVLPSALSEAAFNAMTALDAAVTSRFVQPPNLPAKPVVQSSYKGVALGTVNVTDYAEYQKADEATVKAFEQSGSSDAAMSVETTHGVIRSQSEAPFIFISAITDRVGHFDTEVGPNEYAQNFAAAHNAGVVLAAMLPKIDSNLP